MRYKNECRDCSLLKKGCHYTCQFVRLDNFDQLCPKRFMQIGRDVKEDDDDIKYEKPLLLKETAEVINNTLYLVASQRFLLSCCSLLIASCLQALSSSLSLPTAPCLAVCSWAVKGTTAAAPEHDQPGKHTCWWPQSTARCRAHRHFFFLT